MPSYSERGRREGTACADLSLAALSAFPACLLSSSRHSWPSPPAIVPSVHPSSHQAIHPAFFPSFLSSQRPSFPQISFPAVPHPGPPSRGRASPQSFRLLLRSCTTVLPGASFQRESFRRVFPEHCSRPACLPQSFSPPVTRLPCRLTLAIPARGFFPWMSS